MRVSRRMHISWYVMTASLWMALAGIGDAATLLVSNPDGGMGAAEVDEQYKIVGVVGDYIDLAPGEHDMQIDAPRSYMLVVKVQVSEDGGIVIKESRNQPGPCTDQFATTWAAPTLVHAANTYTLSVATPQFGAASKHGSCAAPMMLGCTLSMAIVAVDSAPPGAEVWIDGKRMNMATKATLSVPFCPGHDTIKRVLVRMPGRVNCSREVSVASGVESNVMCDLKPPN